MNLRGIANAAIQAVNPNRTITWLRHTGQYTTEDDGTDVPVFESVAVSAQIQATSSESLQFLDGLNVQGLSKEVWLYPHANGVVRVNQKGGDLLVFPLEGETEPQQWKVTTVLEQWSNWCHVLVTLQTESVNYDDTNQSQPPDDADPEFNE